MSKFRSNWAVLWTLVHTKLSRLQIHKLWKMHISRKHDFFVLVGHFDWLGQTLKLTKVYKHDKSVITGMDIHSSLLQNHYKTNL